MNFGYLIVVSQSHQANYLKLAYALALSIKNTQKPGYNQVALVIDSKRSLKSIKSLWVFDHIIKWNKQNYWNGRSYMDQLSPFEYTVCLDADMLFLRDYSHWIDYFIENCELYIANQAYNYRGETITNSAYRQAFVKNNLPNLYSFYTFFKKGSALVDNFFNLNRDILQNSSAYVNLFLTKHRPHELGTDEIFALAAKILGIEDQIAYKLQFPRVVHLKGMVQNWPWPAENWDDHVGFYFNQQAQLKIGNYQQLDIVHYVKKDKIDNECISILENIAWNK
jgi:hypothetical protein